jgi:hypothetical protein
MADEKKLDETVPGGKYIVGDRYVDASGKDLGPVSAKGKKAGAEDEADEEPKKDK